MPNIVVGYDGTAGARAALDEATRLANDLGLSVHVVFAHENLALGGEAGDLDRVIAERAQTMLTEAVARVAEAGGTADTEIVQGRIAHALVEVADRTGARFIVVGSYGEKPLKGILVGSTPYKLLQLSETPVVVVRADEDED